MLSYWDLTIFWTELGQFISILWFKLWKLTYCAEWKYDHKQICVALVTLSWMQIPLQVCIIAIYIIPAYHDQMKLLGVLPLRKGEVVIIWDVKASTIYWNTWEFCECGTLIPCKSWASLGRNYVCQIYIHELTYWGVYTLFVIIQFVTDDQC